MRTGSRNLWHITVYVRPRAFIHFYASRPGKFIEALFSGKLISQQSLDQMIRLQSGVDSFTLHGKTFYGHTGGVDGFGSWLYTSREEKLTPLICYNGKVYAVENWSIIFSGSITTNRSTFFFESLKSVLKRWINMWRVCYCWSTRKISLLSVMAAGSLLKWAAGPLLQSSR